MYFSSKKFLMEHKKAKFCQKDAPFILRLESDVSSSESENDELQSVDIRRSLRIKNHPVYTENTFEEETSNIHNLRQKISCRYLIHPMIQI
uniref:Uncharacterized protein n=1 Tax=Acrobeloides nanus TaxID=290746 RepID=A0A914DBD0_9BILA